MQLKHVAYLGPFKNTEMDETFEPSDGFVVLTVRPRVADPEGTGWTETEDGDLEVKIMMDDVVSVELHTRED